jgi:hypothetical protein
MSYVVKDYAKRAAVSPSPVERCWLRVMSTLNEYRARLFVAEKALEMGRGGTSRLSKLTGKSRVTITSGLSRLRSGKRLREVCIPISGLGLCVRFDLARYRDL